jgi:hypothetical protein
MKEYKGYVGRVELDDEPEIFHGEVINTQHVITFQGCHRHGCLCRGDRCRRWEARARQRINRLGQRHLDVAEAQPNLPAIAEEHGMHEVVRHEAAPAGPGCPNRLRPWIPSLSS